MTDVLVVDDDGAIRRIVRIALEFAGYAVCEAADGRFALDHLCAHPHGHVILLDREMPRLNGVQTLEAIARQTTAQMRHVVIMITGSRLELPPDFAHVPVLSKPFNIDELIAMVECAAQRLVCPTSTTLTASSQLPFE